MINTTKLSIEEKEEVRAMYRHSDRQLKHPRGFSGEDIRRAYSICALLEQLFGEELFKGE